MTLNNVSAKLLFGILIAKSNKSEIALVLQFQNIVHVGSSDKIGMPNLAGWAILVATMLLRVDLMAAAENNYQ